MVAWLLLLNYRATCRTSEFAFSKLLKAESRILAFSTRVVSYQFSAHQNILSRKGTPMASKCQVSNRCDRIEPCNASVTSIEWLYCLLMTQFPHLSFSSRDGASR